MWIYVYMYILFNERCVLHFVGGYAICRHTMIKLWSWEYPGCGFEGFWNMERKYGLKRTNLQVFLHIFCQQMIWFTPKTAKKLVAFLLKQNWTYPIPTRWVSRDSPEKSLAGWYGGGFMGAVVKFGLWPTSVHQWSCGWAWLLKQLGGWRWCVRGTPLNFLRLGSRIMEVDGRSFSFLNSKWGICRFQPLILQGV